MPQGVLPNPSLIFRRLTNMRTPLCPQTFSCASSLVACGGCEHLSSLSVGGKTLAAGGSYTTVIRLGRGFTRKAGWPSGFHPDGFPLPQPTGV